MHSLEIQLGYQHRGAEAMLLASPPARRLAIAETLTGDTSIGRGAAHVRTLEGLSGIEVPLQAQVIRGLALELERLANHLGDLGALCNDVGYLPGSAYFGRLRGEFLNFTLELCGNRFGRGLLKPGGVRFDCPEAKGRCGPGPRASAARAVHHALARSRSRGRVPRRPEWAR